MRRPSGFIEPCLPSKAVRPPTGPLWVHEIKHDGYRLMVRQTGRDVRAVRRVPMLSSWTLDDLGAKMKCDGKGEVIVRWIRDFALGAFGIFLGMGFIPIWAGALIASALGRHNLSENIFIFGMVSWIAIRTWVGWRLDYNWRKYRDYLYSPEGQRRRAEEVQATIAELVADARRLGSHTERVIPVGSATFSAAAVMTEAHRLAKNLAKEKLRDRGVKVNEVEASQIAEIARVLVNADPSIVETANVNLEKRSKGA